LARVSPDWQQVNMSELAGTAAIAGVVITAGVAISLRA